jgi:hypothetical protein
MLRALIVALSMGLVAPVHGRPHRSQAAVNAFKRENPCPSTGTTRGKCPNYVVDHKEPLCAGGADHKSNMQWQSISAAKDKDKQERALCKRRTSTPD